MGFLGVKGEVISYNNYKDKIEQYKRNGLEQLISLYKAHMDKKIPVE